VLVDLLTLEYSLIVFLPLLAANTEMLTIYIITGGFLRMK